jgi:transposase
MVKFVSAYKRKKAKEVERKKKQRRSPRFGQLALSQILLLRNQGKSYPEIARAAYVRKKDGSRANQQAVAYQCQTKVLQKRRGTFAPAEGQGVGGGRKPVLTEKQKEKVAETVEKYRFERVRAPWIKKHLKLKKASVRVVQRTIQEAGYTLPQLTNRRVLDTTTKQKRVKWCEDRLRHNAEYWGNRAFGDAHWSHVPRGAAELAAARGAAKGPVHRKKKEKDDPRFHGGEKGVFKQGRRVGLFGVLAEGVLRTVWYDGVTESADAFVEAMEKAKTRFLQAGKKVLYLDGLGAYHGPEAAAALKAAGFRTVEKVPPNSPDLNPIENAWALLGERMKDTDPEELESVQAFKTRTDNAVRWLNRNKRNELVNMVESTQRGLAAAIKLKGARTSY